jgi:hypothetical protein
MGRGVMALVDYWPEEDPLPTPPTDDRESAEYWRWRSIETLRVLIRLDVESGEEMPVRK